MKLVTRCGGGGRRKPLYNGFQGLGGISGLGLDAYPGVPTRQPVRPLVRPLDAQYQLFQNFDLNVAQLLLTGEDFNDLVQVNGV